MSKVKLFLWKTDINTDLPVLSLFGGCESPSFLMPAHAGMRKSMSVCLQRVRILTFITFNNTHWPRGFLCSLKKLTILCHSAQPARCFLSGEGTAAFFWSIRHQLPAGAWTGWATLTSLPQGVLLHTLVWSDAGLLWPHASWFAPSRSGVRAVNVKPLAKPGFWLLCLHAISCPKLPARLGAGRGFSPKHPGRSFAAP